MGFHSPATIVFEVKVNKNPETNLKRYWYQEINSRVFRESTFHLERLWNERGASVHIWSSGMLWCRMGGRHCARPPSPPGGEQAALRYWLLAAGARHSFSVPCSTREAPDLRPICKSALPAQSGPRRYKAESNCADLHGLEDISRLCQQSPNAVRS